MKLTVTQNMVNGILKMITPYRVCKGCMLGKHHHTPFNFGNAWHASNLLELVHNDLYCINKPSLEGVGYVPMFIDDLSC